MCVWPCRILVGGRRPKDRLEGAAFFVGVALWAIGASDPPDGRRRRRRKRASRGALVTDYLQGTTAPEDYLAGLDKVRPGRGLPG